MINHLNYHKLAGWFLPAFAVLLIAGALSLAQKQESQLGRLTSAK